MCAMLFQRTATRVRKNELSIICKDFFALCFLSFHAPGFGFRPLAHLRNVTHFISRIHPITEQGGFLALDGQACLVQQLSVMNPEEFRIRAKHLVDFIADYHQSHHERSPLASDRPLDARKGEEEKNEFPTQPPETPMQWDDVMHLFETNLMPGVSVFQMIF